MNFRRNVWLVSGSLFVLLAGCSAQSEESSSESALSGGTTTEGAFADGETCTMIIPGTPSATSSTFAIWNLGHSIIDVPFGTDRPDMLAVFPGTSHHVPGFDAYDHDHVLDRLPGDAGYDGTWDLYQVTPGPNFDPATYVAAKSKDGVLALIADGILSGPAPVGIVLHMPLTNCK